jgi:hypothetical protein
MAHPDLDKLLNALFPFAQQMLGKYREFHPFGASIGTDGSETLIGAYGDGEENQNSTELIEMLETGLQQAASQGKIRAAGICFDVRVLVPNEIGKTDAIQATLEQLNGGAVNVFLPYKRKGFFKRISYGEVFASPSEPKIFPALTGEQ